MKAISSGTFAFGSEVERLSAMGRRNGGLTFDDLRANLPLATMTGMEIAEAIARLEQTGIEIDVDDDLVAATPGLPLDHDSGSSADRRATASLHPGVSPPPRRRAGLPVVGIQTSPAEPVVIPGRRTLVAALLSGVTLLVLLAMALALL